MTTYAVNHNMPGYLPESDGWTFDVYSDAVEALVEEIERYYDDLDLSIADHEAIEEAILDLHTYAHGHEGADLGTTLTILDRDTHFFLAVTT